MLACPLVQPELEKIHPNQAGIEDYRKGLDCSS